MGGQEMKSYERIRLMAVASFLAASIGNGALAQSTYDTGANDQEVKIGNILAYSGPVSSLGVIGKVEAAYFKKVNDEGGINGRKINFISYDDAYSPPKTVEQARKLVESDEVLLIFNPVGTATNAAIQKYMNTKKVPQLFVGGGATRWNNPGEFPWTMGFQPNYQSEGRVFARYILKEKPDAKIAVLFQNDDLGKDYLKGLRDGLGARSSMIIMEESYEVSEPTIDSHIVKMKASGADVIVSIALPKVAAQSIRKVSELGWKPLFILSSIGASIGTVIRPAGFENAQGIISTVYLKDPADPQWTNDESKQKFDAFIAKYVPDVDKNDYFVTYAYVASQTMVKVLEQCGNNLTRSNVMRQAASLKDFKPDMILPGVNLNTSASDFAPMEEMRTVRLQGERWQIFGDVMSSSSTGN
jgi:branched-chain amino acid transport system substrate-binding protein